MLVKMADNYKSTKIFMQKVKSGIFKLSVKQIIK